MRAGRELLDHWLMGVKESELIPDGGEILEIGSGQCWEHYAMFHDRYKFQPSDVTVYKEVPGEVYLDAMDFSTSELVKDRERGFDAILASQTLEHVTHPEIVMRQCYEHLADGGVTIVTLPFWYRLHESNVDDPEITERGMRDYQRLTPSGLEYLFYRTGYERFHVRALYEGEGRKYTPPFVVGWAQRNSAVTPEEYPQQVKIWNPTVPDNWRAQQMSLEADFNRNVVRGRQ